MKKLHMGTMSFGSDTMDEVVHQLETAFGASHARQGSLSTGVQLATRGRRDMSARIRDVVLSLALCHNVRFRLFFALMTDNSFPGHSRH
jgi:phospholipid-translocating ATPase